MDVRLDEQGHAIVLLDEEYGFRLHVWFTGMTPAALETFWAGLASISDYYLNPTGNFPGQFDKAFPESKSLPGTFHTATSSEDETYWYSLRTEGGFYTAHLHGDDDSGLTAPDGRSILHAGYKHE